ncbi:MAG: histidine triad family protein [Planctomycetota bacterium]|jgi:histidine triad (HIT) family protein
MPSVFSRIIAGSIPGRFVCTSERWVAFLDINPVADGHVLLVPVHEAPRIQDLPAETLAELGPMLARLTVAVRAATGCPAVNVIVNDGPEAGQEVPHAHIHVIPRSAGDGQRVGLRHHAASAESLDAMQAKLKGAWR